LPRRERPTARHLAMSRGEPPTEQAGRCSTWEREPGDGFGLLGNLPRCQRCQIPGWPVRRSAQVEQPAERPGRHSPFGSIRSRSRCRMNRALTTGV
jgi:hypothetical protein